MLVQQLIYIMSSEIYRLVNFLLFSQALNQEFTVGSFHFHYYTFLNKLFGLGFIQMFFHDKIFYFLTAVQTLTFGHIKLTPYVVITDIFLDIVFNQYLGKGWGKKLQPKTLNESIVASFRFLILPMVSCPFCDKLEAAV